MAARENQFTGIDQNIAANLRTYREAAGISQDELAQRMADRGFGFSQTTIWKIESGQRPVRASELVALTDSLDLVLSPLSLTREPDEARHLAQLRRAASAASDAYQAVKAAAAAYMEAQFTLLVAAREAHDDGLALTELETAWLATPPEEAAIEARVQTYQEGAREEQVGASLLKVLDALRADGYEPLLRIEDLEFSTGGRIPALAPPADGEPPAAESPDGNAGAAST